MAILKKYNLQGEEKESVECKSSLVELQANSQMVKDYMVAYRANQRQWSANTKSRSEVSHSGQKPHPQKGTGRARQGYLGAPQYKGGGRVFGPKPKFNQHVKVNKKEKQAVVRHLFAQKIEQESLHLLSVDQIFEPKTKTFAQFLKNMNLLGTRVLFIGQDSYEQAWSLFEEGKDVESELEKVEKKWEEAAKTRLAILKSLRNIPKVSFSMMSHVNGYELALHQNVVILDGAVEQLLCMLESKEVYE